MDDTALREQLSNLTSLCALTMLMSDRRDERQILDLAASAVASLTACTLVAGCLASEDMLLRSAAGHPLVQHELSARLAELDGADGPVPATGEGWARAVALRSVGGLAGYLVVAADREPTCDQSYLLTILAQQTGCALTNAALHRRERASAAELRRLNAELAGLNDRLAATVADLEQRRNVHETLNAVVASGAGAPGIAAAVHELTGLPVAVEDRFGHLRAWAGPDEPVPYPRLPARRRAEVLADARRSPRPVRDRDRVISLAQPHDEVLGVLALVDRGHRAAELELFALEHATVVLAMELAHQRSLAESELRLRRDLTDDLLAGTDDESALSRAAALGHDLRTPHQVVALRWSGAPSDESLTVAVEHAVTQVLDAGALVARRSGTVVLIAARPDGWGDRHRWVDLHRTIAKLLRSDTGAMGISGVCTSPSQLPRASIEAERALRIRLGSSMPVGVTVHDDLGIYRLLALGEDDREVTQYVREWLGPLLDYDASNHSDLVTTLWQYLECGGNYDATAAALLIHRSTLRYRLRRIRELSGHDLGDVDSKLNLHVATRAWQIHRGSS